jgi:FMN phosphatase YigB (HAD superfamily)
VVVADLGEISVMLKAVFFDIGDTLVITSDKTWVSGAKEALTALRALGLRLGIISNTGDLSREKVLDLLPADFNFGVFENDLIILSSEVHLKKPDPAIFRLAVKRANVKPGECLFCTEELDHTLIAQQTGMLAARVLQPPSNSDAGQLAGILKSGGLVP